jgi:hypothetical protein
LRSLNHTRPPPCRAFRFKHGGRGWSNPLKAEVPNAGAREELRNPDQVRKAFKEEEAKKEHLMRVRRQGGGCTRQT